MKIKKLSKYDRLDKVWWLGLYFQGLGGLFLKQQEKL